jgi:uncharacterized membrane protein
MRNETNPSDQVTMINVPENERTMSLIGGGLLTVFGVVVTLAKRNPVGALLALLGGSLIYQGATGYSPLYKMLGANRAVRTNQRRVSVPHEQGEHISAVVVINRPVEELYAIWKNFQNLPQIMSYLDKVEIKDDKHSRWTVKSPVGTNVSWDAEVINDVPNEVIGWRSLASAQVANAGSVRFRPAPYRQGSTEIRVTLEYVAPGQKLGVAVAKWLGQHPEQQLQDDLERFKMYIENNEFKPAGPPTSWLRTDEGQFRAQDEGQYNIPNTASSGDAEDINRDM